jgi:hypothetical protein
MHNANNGDSAEDQRETRRHLYTGETPSHFRRRIYHECQLMWVQSNLDCP